MSSTEVNFGCIVLLYFIVEHSRDYDLFPFDLSFFVSMDGLYRH